MGKSRGEPKLPKAEPFHELAEQATEPIAILQFGRFVYMNAAYAKALGFQSRADAYAASVTTLLDPQEAALASSYEARILADRSCPPARNFHVRRVDGTSLVLQVRGSYFEYHGLPSVLCMAWHVGGRAAAASHAGPEDPSVPGEPSVTPPQPRRTRVPRVLIVDDERLIGTTLCDLLAPEHEVRAVTTADDAFRLLLGDEFFDVIFCDLMMPGISGIDLFERLRRERPGLQERIVFMTGGAYTARASEFLATVQNRRLEKPFSLGLVERIVREMGVLPDWARATDSG